MLPPPQTLSNQKSRLHSLQLSRGETSVSFWDLCRSNAEHRRRTKLRECHPKKERWNICFHFYLNTPKTRTHLKTNSQMNTHKKTVGTEAPISVQCFGFYYAFHETEKKLFSFFDWMETWLSVSPSCAPVLFWLDIYIMSFGGSQHKTPENFYILNFSTPLGAAGAKVLNLIWIGKGCPEKSLWHRCHWEGSDATKANNLRVHFEACNEWNWSLKLQIYFLTFSRLRSVF